MVDVVVGGAGTADEHGEISVDGLEDDLRGIVAHEADEVGGEVPDR